MIASRWFHHVHKPISCFTEDVKLGRLPEISSTISFRLQDLDILARYKNRDEYEKAPHEYYCESCLCACGNGDKVFKTGSAPLKELVDGPNQEQREQMSVHAEQHSIIWSWARQQGG